MLLATTQVEDLDRFMDIFSTQGAEKRKQHGSKGATIFRDPSEEDRVWVIFDWDEQGWQSFVSDPEVPPISSRREIALCHIFFASGGTRLAHFISLRRRRHGTARWEKDRDSGGGWI